MAMGPGFKIVEGPMDAKWFNVSASNTVMIGQLVKYSPALMGVAPLAAAADAPQAYANGYPLGVAVAINNRTPLSNSTYSTQYGTGASTQATLLARDYFGVEGMTAKGDPQLQVLVALITLNVSVIEGPIFKTSYGTAPGVVTCTTAGANGIAGMVHGAGDAAAYAIGVNMYYGRSGNNTGLYRSSNAASTTTPTFELGPWPYGWVVGDTFAMINFGVGQNQKIQTDAYSMFIDNAANTTGGAHFMATVLSMDLTKPGQETAQFRFCSALS